MKMLSLARCLDRVTAPFYHARMSAAFDQLQDVQQTVRYYLNNSVSLSKWRFIHGKMKQ
jgi:hypothetical protein